MNEKKKTICTNIKTSRNEDISFLQLSYGNFVSLDDYMLLKKENQQLKEQLQQKDEIIKKAKEFVCDYKKQWALNDDVVDDMEVLLKILDNKGE